MTDAVAEDETLDELNLLRDRIDQQSEELTRHARELSQLRHDLEQLNERLDDHQHGDVSLPARHS
jgi:chromosome segregation ATPase